MWEPHFSRLRDIPDVVRAYELVDSSYPVLSANVNALVVNESDETTLDVGNENEINL